MNEIVYAGRHSLMYTVHRHVHESWEFVYCTWGEGAFRFDGGDVPYHKGDVVPTPRRRASATSTSTCSSP